MKPPHRNDRHDVNELQQLRARLEEAEETLRAIRGGEVDALVVATIYGDRVFSLSGAEHPYRIMVETMNEGAVTLAADGTILYGNHRFTDIVRQSLEQIRGASFYRYVAASERHLIQALIERSPKGNKRIELSLRSGDGTIVPVMLSISSFRHEDMPGAVCLVVTDLTEQKRNESLLAEEQLIGQILNQTEEIVIICDNQGSIIRASQSTIRFFGSIPLFQPFDEAFSLQYPDGSPFVLLDSLNDTLIHAFEVTLTVDGDKSFSFLMNAKSLRTPEGVLGIVVVMVDITARKREEEILRTSEIRYRRLFETARDGIVILNAETGRIEDVNPFLVNLLGYPESYFVGKKLWTLGAFKETAAWQVELSALMNQESPLHKTVHLRRKDGQVLAVEFTCSAFQVDQRDVIQCNIRDITEREKIMEALQKSHDELEQRVEERTAELTGALAEIKVMKDQLEAENIYFRQERTSTRYHDDILGQSDSLKEVLYRAEQVAPTNATVLILGETGTGKELIAHAIHNLSPRKQRPMITVNCATLPANLIESELFGREKGAFTGADVRQLGRFEIANGSTLCLDEIGELPLEMQAKLLRAIQHGEFERLGSSHTIKVDVRIIATTNRNLEEEIRQGRFRQDLFYRLNVFPLVVPPLRLRKDDIPQLAQAFIQRFARKMGKTITSIQKESMRTLQDYAWPGNIRELESIIERAVILCPGPVLQLTEKLDLGAAPVSETATTLEEVERNQILKILKAAHWRIEGAKGAAKLLGLHPSTLRARMHKLGIERPRPTETE